MYHSVIKRALIAALLLSANLSFAVEKTPSTPEEAKAIKDTQTPSKAIKPKQAKVATQVKPVDINSASKAELKKLPGISDAEAGKIIAGRPYLTKAHLVTRNIISAAAYENLKKLVIAKQKPDIKAKSK